MVASPRVVKTKETGLGGISFHRHSCLDLVWEPGWEMAQETQTPHKQDQARQWWI